MHSLLKPAILVLTSTWNPRINALTKSAAFVREPMSCVSLHVWNKKGILQMNETDTTVSTRENQYLSTWLKWLNVLGKLTLISTLRVLRLNLTWSCRFSTIGVKIFSQFSFSGVYLWAGTAILRISSGPWNTHDTVIIILRNNIPKIVLCYIKMGFIRITKSTNAFMEKRTIKRFIKSK